jgi:hypothetical protein
MNKLKTLGIGITSVLGVAVVWKAWSNTVELAAYKTLTNQDLVTREDPDFIVETLMLKQWELHDSRDLGNISYLTHIKELTRINKDWAIKGAYKLVDKE